MKKSNCKIMPSYKHEAEKVKIALLTPYTGGNLGDAAIQEAVIANIRKRYQEVDIYLISLRPDVTAKLHGISSFPISALAITSYSSGLLVKSSQGDSADTSQTFKHVLLHWVKTTTKRISFLHSALKQGYELIDKVGKVPVMLWKEIVHITRAYKLMKGVSLLLVSGGGQLDDYWGGSWRHPYALFKWGLIARMVGAKYLFLSVGTCSLESRVSVFFIHQALRLADYRSYRDDTSKRLLGHMAFTRNDHVYPDLAFSHLKAGLMSSQGGRKVERVVGVSPIAYLSRYWPKKNFPIYESYIKNLVDSISNLIRLGYTILLFSTDTPDRHVVTDLVDSLFKDTRLNVKGKIHQQCADTPEDLFLLLSNVDYVVASRLHGVLLSHLVNKPVIAVSYDRKVDTYMNGMDLSEYCLNIHNFDTISFVKVFESLVDNTDLIKSSLKEKVDELTCDLDRQYDFILGK